jgi:hypothetical protein
VSSCEEAPYCSPASAVPGTDDDLYDGTVPGGPSSKYYPARNGPRVRIDETHDNVHTLLRSYLGFSKLLKDDGYQVKRFDKAHSTTACGLGTDIDACTCDFCNLLKNDTDILVIANPEEGSEIGRFRVFRGWREVI